MEKSILTSQFIQVSNGTHLKKDPKILKFLLEIC